MDKLYGLSLHETIPLPNSTEVTRVPGGWVYRFFQFHQVSGGDGQWSENYVADSVFVPFNNEFQRPAQP